jgi:hypothetical protein
MDAVTGGSKDNPIFMKLIRDDDGVKWGNIVVMLALTVVSGYLATKSQRAGSKIDFEREVKMRVAMFGEKLGNEITRAGVKLSLASSRAYDKARPV